MRIHIMRLFAVVVSAAMMAMVGALGIAPTASAQPPAGGNAQNTVDITGTGPGGKQVFTGTFTATGPVRENPNPGEGPDARPLLVTGLLKGELDPSGGQSQGQGRGPVRPVEQTVEMPAKINPQAAAAPAAGESFQGTCEVLSLILGPLDLQLLGLRVQLNQVELLITAIPGGGLLGDLLCALAGGPSGTPPLAQIVDLLNQILGILGGL
ncbi:hypothetical protein [Mycobacterium sp. IDR2000157661]|uniref:hypothetical protein n=1 Tax=Mycobacterium sp. IDR2000157661 TaxID=2867005 RepID=UPI001EEC60E1|nr:hypothetical protein [Mycobacterium sp. IDR2000157661]ULE33781.1 hypothetical protein K3G64_03540 [Mycobacterium sp. IDR2000157661]